MHASRKDMFGQTFSTFVIEFIIPVKRGNHRGNNSPQFLHFHGYVNIKFL